MNNRISDVGNVFSQRGPLKGFFKNAGTPVSFEASLQPIEAYVLSIQCPLDMDDFRTAISSSGMEATDQKSHYGDSKDDIITRDELAAIFLYTMEFPSGFSFYTLVNDALRAEDRKCLKSFIDYLWLFMHALRSCPSYQGPVVFRGLKIDIHASFVKDRVITWHPFSSCTRDIAVDAFLGPVGPRNMFHIELTTGRGRLIQKYSQIKREQEVLLPPGSRFIVLGVASLGNDLFMVHLRELPPSEVILSFDLAEASSASVSAGVSAGVSASVSAGVSAAAVQEVTGQLSTLKMS